MTIDRECINCVALAAAVALVGVILPAGIAWAEGSCAGSCHEKIRALPHKHGALQMGDCTDCHDPSESKDATCTSGNTFAMSEDPALCVDCHDEVPQEGRHPALDDGCTACHNPHGGQEQFNLHEGSIRAQCFDCHDEFPEKPASMHPPVAQGLCTKCHNPHQSPNDELLRKPRQQLCHMCHDREKLLGKDAELGTIHRPVGIGDCLDCHFPHTSENGKLLRLADNDLCLDCHDEKAENPHASFRRFSLESGNVHGAIDGGSCTDCHKPHGSPNVRLLTMPRPELCFDCHDEFEKPFKHSAVRLGRCNGCHEPHVSTHDTLLKAQGADLCFGCHSDDLTGRPTVHKPVGDGRCLDCHHPHEADQRNLLIRGPVVTTCLSCHGKDGESSLKVDLDKKTVHGAITRFGCTRCHDPHGGNNRRLLVAEPPPLCIKCHAMQADGRHAFTAFDGRPHPVEGPRDPSRPEHKMDCTGCHSPHATNFPKLWKQGETKMQLCSRCHKKFQSLVSGESPAKKPKSSNSEPSSAGALRNPSTRVVQQP